MSEMARFPAEQTYKNCVDAAAAAAAAAETVLGLVQMEVVAELRFREACHKALRLAVELTS